MKVTNVNNSTSKNQPSFSAKLIYSDVLTDMVSSLSNKKQDEFFKMMEDPKVQKQIEDMKVYGSNPNVQLVRKTKYTSLNQQGFDIQASINGIEGIPSMFYLNAKKRTKYIVEQLINSLAKACENIKYSSIYNEVPKII